MSTIALILRKETSSFEGKESLRAVLSNGSNCKLTQEEYESLSVGDSVFVESKKFKKDNSWLSYYKFLTKVTLG